MQLLAKYISKMLELQIYGNEVISITEDKLLNIERLKNIDIQIFNERGSLEMSIKNNNSFDFTSLKSLGNKFKLFLIKIFFIYIIYVLFLRCCKYETLF